MVSFSKLRCIHDLTFDDSFVMEEMDESAVCKALADEAVLRYLRGESVQVLFPYNKATNLSVVKLNAIIRDRVNPPEENKRELRLKETVFRDGDRVIIMKNDRERNRSTRDVGGFRILESESEFDVLLYRVELPDGRTPTSITFIRLA